MSIIQDALKKADKKRPVRSSVFVGYAEARKEDVLKAAAPVKQGGNFRFRYIIYALTLLVLVVIFASGRFPATKSRNVVVPVVLKNKAEPMHAVQPVPQPAEKKIAVISEPVVKKPDAPALPKEPAIQPNEFTLSGIMHLEDGPRAIINNMRVVEGDDVDGAKVVSITDDTVVLKKQDSEIKLRLK